MLWKKKPMNSNVITSEAKQSVLVIGGGIAGMQASIDLAEMGFKVYLVEKSPSIGGRMAQLDKTFPTNDCSICILAPKMADCNDHPNVNVITCSEVKEVKGKAGDFKVKVLKKARLVDEKKCTGCGQCAEKCPTKVPDEFNMGLGTRKAAYLYFLQAVPRVALIDRDHCVRITKGPTKDGKPRCGICIDVCQAGAIDFEQKDEELELNVGAIVVATGFDPYDPSPLTEYGYGRFKNVITALEFERVICASGPTGGHLKRLSKDSKEPKKIAFIQCVGSRDVNYNKYCAAVCCMHSTKEAILSREHDPEVQSFIFYTDIRASGKGFQDYVARAEREYGVTYIRGRVGKIDEDSDENLVVHYADTLAREVKTMQVDLVVLATCLVPRKEAVELARVIGIQVDENEFFRSDPFSSTEAEVPGIFLCGYCQGPKDIPESVTQASAAAMKAAEFFKQRQF
jgi:heterodisulfide reductase subunit A